MASSSDTKTCIIIGGGLGGLTAAAGLRKVNSAVRIVLVEPKDYCEVFWATYRSPFDSVVAEKSLKPLAEFCAKHAVEHVATTVEQLTTQQQEAVLGNGTTIAFDVCVVAVGAGCKWEACGRGLVQTTTRADRLQALQAEGEALVHTATSVVIVGGGLIGSELAGDVAFYKQQNKLPVNVTLIQSGPQLCQEMSAKSAALVQKKLEQLGVRVILNERANVDGSNVKLGSSGETIAADRVVMTVGNVPVTGFMDPSVLDETGLIQVEKTFAVKNTDNKIFSIGDCCDLLPNQGAQVLEQKRIIGGNLNAVLLGGDSSSLSLCKESGLDLYNCTVGPRGGVTHTSMFGTSTWPIPWLKNKTMFFFKFNSDLGFKG